MRIDLNNAITILSGLLMFAGAIYRLAHVESSINAKIKAVETNVLGAVDGVEDKLIARLYETDKKLDVHLTEYAEKKGFLEYRLNANEQLIKHKFERLAGWIKQITAHLGRDSGFHIKDDQF
jgi:predicted transcriptional regulator with HTH domain